MKVSDYIVEFFISKGIQDVFGYPGGMVTHLMDSFDKYRDKISAHLNYNEQGASFSVCGYAQYNGSPSVAYGTSGPGATNMITGICDAYFDSVPAIFITGQVNTYEGKGNYNIRQKGFQETDIISLVSGITKYATYVDSEQDIKYYLERAYYEATEGRKGPVCLDIPMNIQRMEVEEAMLRSFEPPTVASVANSSFERILEIMKQAKRPCILAGAGINTSGMRNDFRVLADKLKIPIVTSMIAVDLLPSQNDYNFGFIGAYGHRAANFIISKCDVILSIGSRIDGRQTGAKLENFAQDAVLIRIDIDENEFERRVKEDEAQILGDIKDVIPYLIKISEVADNLFDNASDVKAWTNVCRQIKTSLEGLDESIPNKMFKKISEFVGESDVIVTDVGQNQVWAAQSFNLRGDQRMLFSGGHGAMGYSLPASIGAYYASGKNVISFSGDGGFQMNIQELQFVAHNNIPVSLIVFNNKSLGMIRHFQEMYFDSNYVQTKHEKGYSAPDFKKIGDAYGIKSFSISSIDEINSSLFSRKEPRLIDINLNFNTYVFPKLAYNKPNYDQEPPLDENLVTRLNMLIDTLAPIRKLNMGKGY